MRQMDFISSPARAITGSITVPGDKSISHRSIIFAAIAEGITVINGFLEAEDCIATINAFRMMGVCIERSDTQQLVVHGVGKHGLKAPSQIINCGNSGTSMRLLAGLLAGQAFDSILTGDDSLLKRPMLRITKPLQAMGAKILSDDGKAPLHIFGGCPLKAIQYELPEASAQVKSCILLAGLYAQGDTVVSEIGISRDHTEIMLENFSYPVYRKDNTLKVNSDNQCQAATLFIPGDISSAAFFIVAATIIPGSNITLKNVGVNPTRTGIITILKEMGAKIALINKKRCCGEWIADINVQYAPLKGIPIPSEWVPIAIDEFPILFIAAACAEGKTILRDARELRVKETDRIAAMADGLYTLGIRTQVFEDGIAIEGGTLQGGTVDSRGDHRIAMSFSIAGAVASAAIVVKDCTNVATSFPSFLDTANALQLAVKEHSEYA